MSTDAFCTCRRFRLFDFNRDDCKVLDEDTDGGLMAEFGHMVWKPSKLTKLYV